MAKSDEMHGRGDDQPVMHFRNRFGCQTLLQHLECQRVEFPGQSHYKVTRSKVLR